MKPADLAFMDGGVFTADPALPFCEAVAVRGDTIVAVGTNDDVAPSIGPRTEVVSLRDRLLLPGFQDAHVHAPAAGLTRLGLDLAGAHTPAEYAERIRAYADATPRAPWVVGSGWYAMAFPGATPSREGLDAIVADRPAFLSDSNNHAAWVNSRALELAGVTAQTPDPSDGRVVRDAAGRPTGMLLEGAIDLVARLLPRATAADLTKGLLAGQSYLHGLGITAWQDAIVGEYSTIQDNYECYVRAAGSGDLTARVVGALWFDRTKGLEQIPFLVDRRERGQVGRFRATSVKLMLDGACENHAASLCEPYHDVGDAPGGAYWRPGPWSAPLDAHENSGIALIDPDELTAAAVALDAAGFQMHIHALGDRAIRAGLDALGAANERNHRSDARHHMAHLQVLDPADLPRFAELGVHATVQPLWAARSLPLERLVMPALGEPRSSWLFPFAGLRRAGARLAFGSDWPISSPDPLAGVHVAVNRSAPGAGEHDPLHAHEALDLRDALVAATAGSASVNHLDRTGSIGVGMLADLTVLDRDLFAQPAAEIADARVLLTVVDGQPVHEAPGW